jgi:hypothetical protein
LTGRPAVISLFLDVRAPSKKKDSLEYEAAKNVVIETLEQGGYVDAAADNPVQHSASSTTSLFFTNEGDGTASSIESEVSEFASIKQKSSLDDLCAWWFSQR